MSTRNTKPSPVRSPRMRITSRPSRVKKSSLSMARAPSVSPFSGNTKMRSMSEEKFSSPPPSLPMPSTISGCASPRGAARLAVAARQLRGSRSPRPPAMAASAKALVSARVSASAAHAGEVAPGDAHHLPLALPAQGRHEAGQVSAPVPAPAEPLRPSRPPPADDPSRPRQSTTWRAPGLRLRASQTKSLAAERPAAAHRAVPAAPRLERRQRAGLAQACQLAAHRMRRGRRSRARDFTRNSYCRRHATAYDVRHENPHRVDSYQLSHWY